MDRLAVSLVLSLVVLQQANAQAPGNIDANQELREVLESVPMGSTLTTTVDGIDNMANDNMAECGKASSSCQQVLDDFNRKKALLQLKANEVDTVSSEGNVLKESLENGMEDLVGAWEKVEKILERQNSILKALDPSYLNVMRVKSATIGEGVRNPKTTSNWPMSKIKTAFGGLSTNLDKVIGALSSSLKGDVVDTAKSFFTASQIHAAIQVSPKQGELKTDPATKDVLGMTEDVVKKNLKNAAIKKYNAWISGSDEAYDYLENSKDFLDEVGKMVDKFNEISSKTSSSEMKTAAQAAISQADKAKAKQDISKTKIDSYKQAVETFSNNDFKPMVKSAMLKQALKGSVKIINGKASSVSALGDAKTKLERFVNDIDNADSATMSSLLTGVNTALDAVDSAVECYQRVTSMIGAVIKSCRAGSGSFDSLYSRAQSEAAIDASTCSTYAGLTEPSKADVKSTLSKLKISTSCQGNRRDKMQDESMTDEETTLSISQQVTVCNLKEKHNKSNKDIADVMMVKESQVALVKCPIGS